MTLVKEQPQGAEELAHATGSFWWTDLATTDPVTAKEFYGALFGWQFDDVPVGEAMTYSMAMLKGQHVAAISGMNQQMRDEGVLPHWTSYLTVDDVDAATVRAMELGGTVLAEPFDVMDAGRMSLVTDPTDATLALWQTTGHPGAGLVNEHGTLTWNELATRDPEAAEAFYGGLVGWTSEKQQAGTMAYTSFTNPVNKRLAAGMVHMNEQWAGIPPHWMVYFAVDDVDETVNLAERIGGRVAVPPTDIPNVGRFALVVDPTGGHFSVITFTAKA